MRLHLVHSAVMSAALLSSAGLHGQEKPVIEIDLSRSGPFKEPVISPYIADETPDGYIFRGPGGLNYQIHIARISPQLAVQITRKGNKYRYDITLENGRPAKDPIRDITFSYNARDITEHPAYSEQRAPNGWTIFDNTFRGELKPNRIAQFSIVNELTPDQTMLVISGIDHDGRTADRLRLQREGISTGLFRFMAKTLGYREYVVYHLNDPKYGGAR
jgi:hypothetical protein